MGINLGAFICNFICGTLAMVYGWHWGFLAAGIGMCLGLVVLGVGAKYLAPDT
jgi:POT family proton-dependent oligopeptide transporter